MAFTYKVIERKNTIPNAKTPKVAMAQAKMIGRVSTKELAEDIADRCTVHRADVVAVLDALSVSTMSFVTKGLGVQLGELGSFSLSVRGKSAPSKEEWKPELLRKARVRYTPSVEMKDRLSRVGFRNLEDLIEGKASQKPTGDVESPTVPGSNAGVGGADESGVVSDL